MSNIGQLLHKLTKYQTLYGFVADESKRSVYSQKIAYYKQQLQQAGINQNNINGVQNLVGGEVYQNEANSLIEKLFLTKQTELSDVHKQTLDNVKKKIADASSQIDSMSGIYKNITETITYIIGEIKKKMKDSGNVPVSYISDVILKELEILENNISKLKTEIDQEKFKNTLNQESTEKQQPTPATQPAPATPATPASTSHASQQDQPRQPVSQAVSQPASQQASRRQQPAKRQAVNPN